jgi:predicted RND superfamily exporter protein
LWEDLLPLSRPRPLSSRLAASFGSAFGFDRLAAFSIDHPWRTVAFFASLVLVAAPGLLRLQLRTDGHALVPPDDPAVRFDAEVRRHFGLRDPIAVVLETSRAEGIFNSDTLRRLRDLTVTLQRVEGVSPDHVASLANERRDRVYPGTLSFRPFLDVVPDSPLQMEIFRGDLEAIEILHGTLVSRDRKAAVVLVGVPNVLDRSGAPGGEQAAAADRVALYHRIVAVSRRFDSPEHRILVVGAPVAEALLGTHILEDLSLLLPLSIGIISVALWLGCRRVAGVLLGLAQLAAAQVWTFGMMGWLGVPVYLTTAVLPVILTTLALADEIHLFWRYQQILGSGEAGAQHPQAVRVLVSQMSRPIVLATVTTVIGFLSFLSSPLQAVRSFGAFAAAGLLFCLVWSLGVGPAALTLLSPGALRRPMGRRTPPSDRIRRAFTPLLGSPRRTLAVLGLATLLGGAGAVRLEVQDSWIGGFAPDSPFRVATGRVNRLFDGTHLLLVHLDLSRWTGTIESDFPLEGEAGPLLDPEILNAIGDFERFLARQPRVGRALGPWSQLATLSFLKQARNPEELRIPATPWAVDDLLYWFDEVRGERRRREVIDDARRRGVITLFLKDPDYRQVKALMAEARRHARERLEPLGIRIGFAGDVAVSQAMIPAIVRTQVYSLPLALLGSLLVVIALYRSVRIGLLIAMPSSLAIVWMLGFMGWSGVPLGVATSMFCAITLGVGIDYGIHLYESFLRQRREGAGPSAALEAVAESGPAILTDTAAIALGFGILGVSQVPANARLGFLVAGALIVSCALTLAGLGTLLDRSAK